MRTVSAGAAAKEPNGVCNDEKIEWSR